MSNKHVETMDNGKTNDENGSNREDQTNSTINELIGPFGWWQMNIASFYFVAYILTTFNNLGISFHAAKTDYNCIESYNGSSTIIPPINDEMFRCDGQCIRWQYNNSVNFKQTIISEVW